MIVGDKVLLYPSHIIDTLTPDNVGRSPGMEPFFGTIVTVSEISSTKKSFKIEGSPYYWFNTNWVNLEHTASQPSICEITKLTPNKHLIYFKELNVYVYDSPNGVIQLTKEQTL